MNRKLIHGIALLFFCLSFQAFSQKRQPIYSDEKQPIEIRVENALSLLTLEEKVALCHAQSKFSVAGVPRLGIPALWMSDGPHGIRAEINWGSWDYSKWTSDSCTAFPSLTCLAATWNPELAYSHGVAIGEESRYRNKDILLAPGVNIYRSPLNGRNFEYLGEDPYLSSIMVVPYIKGVQSNGVAACVKHYMANNQETLRGTINVEMSDRALYEMYLPAFKAAVVEGQVMAVMGAYNKFRGTWCCENPFLLTKTLKDDWGFKGVVVSDWDAVHSTKATALAGLDIEMGTDKKEFKDYYLADPFLKQIKNGEIDIKVLDEKAGRVLRTIFLTSMNRNRGLGSFGTKEHADVSRKIAEEGIVLLKNSQQLLPLNLTNIKSIAVIGDNATRRQIVGGGSSELKAKYEISPLQGIKTRLGEGIQVNYAQGYSSKKEKNEQLFKEALDIASKSDMVLFFGGLNKEEGQDCEGADRKNMQLPYKQDSLITEIQKVNPKVVVVLISGNAMEMPWVANVPAILQVWYPGLEGGNAIASILCGDVNPSGKLPFTFPAKLEQSPAHALKSFPGDGTNVVYKEDIYVGYRWFEKQKIQPLFPFGFGLSYTSFTYGKIVADKNILQSPEKIKISISIKNTGTREGSDVVQLYISAVKPLEDRPVKELKAFKKVKLSPGEEKVVDFEVSKDDLKIYSEKEKGWTILPGKYKIMIGNSSRDIYDSLPFTYKL
jgi:beta-glucosidase